MSGILGPAGALSPYANKVANGSLPDLKQAKRESLEAELYNPDLYHANTA